MKKKSVSRLKKILDKQFSLEVRTRDKFTCQRCGKKGKFVHCAHIFSRKCLSTRYDLRNATTLCYYCHLQFAHRCPVEFAEWCKEKLGEALYLELKLKSSIIIDQPREFLEILWNSTLIKNLTQN